jgi:hypothetical protein
MKAYAPITQPKYCEAWLIGTFAVSDTNVGNEGIIIPKPMESRQMVTNIKSKADFGLMTFMESGFFVQCGKGKELREIGRLRSCEMFFRRGGVLIDRCASAAAECQCANG